MVPTVALNTPEILHLLTKRGIFAPEQMHSETQKFIIKELLAKKSNLMNEGESEDISALKEDILKLLENE